MIATRELYLTTKRRYALNCHMATIVVVVRQEPDPNILYISFQIDIMRRLRHPNVLLFMGAVYSREREKLAIVTEFLPR